MKAKTKKRLGGAVYLLPNLLTTGNLFFGFFSVIKALKGEFTWAASAILLAAIFDVLDGRVARLTNATSEFGVQYDSLCDLMSFGLAPAVLMYQFGLNEVGRIGWVVCFLFLACGALRLARFNVRSSIGSEDGDFVGLPIPMAAISVALYVLVVNDTLVYDEELPAWLQLGVEWMLNPKIGRSFLLVTGFCLALAMVSNVAYRSHKSVKVTVLKPFQLLVIAVLVAGIIAYQPEIIGFVLAYVYALSGPVERVFGLKKAIDEHDIFEPVASEKSVMEPDDES